MKLKRAEKRHKLTTGDYARLAEFRQSLRGFSDEAAAGAGLTTRHYQAMLILRASSAPVTIVNLAQRLYIKHNSAVGLVDRLSQERLIERRPSKEDRRKVELALTGRGREVLAELAGMHREELERIGPLMKRFFSDVSKLGRT